MEYFIFWAIGWLIWMIGYYIYNVYIDKDIYISKRLAIWRGFTSGIFSWFGIFFVIIFFIVGFLVLLNDWIENKLS